MTPALYSIFADVTVAVHALFVFFVAGGQAAIVAGWLGRWDWTRNFAFRITHCAAIIFVVISTWLGITCPLTTLENHFRRQAGTAGYDMSFIGYWLNRLLFYTAPDWVFTLLYSVFGLAVIAMFIVYPPRRQDRSLQQGRYKSL